MPRPAFLRSPAFILAVSLVLHLGLLDWYTCVFTDTIHLIDSDPWAGSRRMPLYLGLLDLLSDESGWDAIYIGRAISALAGALLVVPIYRTAEALFDRRVAVWAAWLTLISPLPFRWSLRAMTDSLYTLLLIAALWCAAELARRPTGRWLGLAIAALGATWLTRPEGVMFAPLALALQAWGFWKLSRVESLKSLTGWSTWLLVILWKYVFTEGAGYGRTASGNLERLNLDHLGHFASFFGGYLTMTVILVTPVVFALSLLSVATLTRLYQPDAPEEERRRRWLWGLVCSYAVAATFALVTVHYFFSTRHLMPVYPLFCLLAAAGAAFVAEHRPRIAQGLVWLAFLSSLVVLAWGLYASRDSFGHVCRAAEVVRADGFEGRVLANDFGADKMGYFAGGDLGYYRRGRVRPGVRVVLDSFESGLPKFKREVDWLESRYRVRELGRPHSRMTPFFADDIAEDRGQNGRMTHLMGHLFRWYDHYAIILEIGERKRPQEKGK